jgi:CO dehydrogenase maturation factor
MKLSVCGKGGSGKSTITTLMAKELASRGKRVLVIDSDESNYGLHQQLGMDLPKEFTGYFGGKDKALKIFMPGELLGALGLGRFAKKFFTEDMTLDEIPSEFVERKGNILLMSGGKIHDANEGCACPINGVISQFVEHLKLGKDDVVLLDMEAGVEHFGRGTDNTSDAVLMVVDPSYESLKLSSKISEICSQIQHPIYYVLNKVTGK